MRFGQITSPELRFLDGDFSHYVALKAADATAANITLRLPSSLPGSTQALVVDTSGNMSYASLGAGGTVTSVGLVAPTSVFNVANSPVSVSGDLELSFKTQTQSTFLAADSTGNSVPSFRAIAWADVSGLAGSSGTSFAVGNDARLHTQNTDTGTTNDTFHLDSDNSGPLLKNNAGVLEVRNAGDTAFADIIVGNVTVRGASTTIESETLAIGDSTIVLNQEYTGATPTENGGIEIERGTQTNASLIWDESSDRWSAGLAGSELQLTRKYSATFNDANLTGGVLTATHNLGTKVVTWSVADDSDQAVIPDQVTFTDTNTLTIDLSSWGTLSGSWTITAIG